MSEAEIAVRAPAATPLRGTLTPTGLELPDDLSFEEWKAIGATLGERARALGKQESTLRWALADWFRFGAQRPQWAHGYDEAIAATGYEKQTLQNTASVGWRIYRRREKLSFHHHDAVAALNAQEQADWLDLAEQDSLSVHDLRAAVQVARKLRKDEDDARRSELVAVSPTSSSAPAARLARLRPVTTFATDEECEAWRIAAAAEDMLVRDWLRKLANEAIGS